MQREEDGDYEDREGENFSVTTDDPFITNREFKCEKCGKKITEKSGTLFAPFHCGRQMKLASHIEHNFDFESLTKRTLEKERVLFPEGKKHVQAKAVKHAKVNKVNRAKTAKKPKPVKKAQLVKLKPRKTSKPTSKKKRK